jgi:hypothetical protein
MVKRLVSLVLAASVTVATPVRAAPPSDEVEVVFGRRTHWTYPGGAVVFEDGKMSEVRF